MAMTNERIGGKESLLKVAAIQIEPQIGDLKGNREKLIHKVNNAFNWKQRFKIQPNSSV